MSETHTQFVGSIPENYDRYLGPLLFERYAADLAHRVSVPPDGRILETACGTGISTQHLREALPGSVRITATDLNTPMLDYAREVRAALANVRFEQADALNLSFESDTFDAVVCQFGLMFFPDKAAGVHEAARVLKPGGTFLLNVWDSFEQNPIVRVAHETIARFFAEDPPQFLTVPFGYYQREPIKRLLADAAFTDIELRAVPTTIERPSARGVATGFVQGTPAYTEIVDRAAASVEEIVDGVAEAFRREFGDAPLRANLQAIVATARASAAVSVTSGTMTRAARAHEILAEAPLLRG